MNVKICCILVPTSCKMSILKEKKVRVAQRSREVSKSLGAAVYAKTKNELAEVWSYFTFKTRKEQEKTPTTTNAMSGFLLRNSSGEQEPYVITSSEAAIITNGFINLRIPPPPKDSSTVRVERLFVRVYSSKAPGKSHIYEAKLAGVDGRGGIAVLRIDPNLPWNKDLPSLKGRGLKWGHSRQLSVGDLGYILALSVHTKGRLFTEGIVRENSFAPPNLFFGGTPLESVCIKAQAAGSDFPERGGAILNWRGRVVGIVNATGLSSDILFGPAQHIAQRIVTRITTASKAKHSRFVELISDALGEYWNVKKAFLDVVAMPLTTGKLMNNILEMLSELPSIDKDSLQVKGYQMGQVLSNSPLFGILDEFDVLVSIAGVEIGFPAPLKVLGSVLWNLLPGERVKIKYRLVKEAYQTLHETTVKLSSYPRVADSPNAGIQKDQKKKSSKKEKRCEGPQ